MGAKRKSKSSVMLDYGRAASKALLENISAAAMAGPYLWTASDEGRTIECLEPHKSGFRLHRQFALDELFASLPGRHKQAEVDTEAIAVGGNRLWICGSHCRVRRNRKDLSKVDPRFRSRPSRCLLGVVKLEASGGGINGRGTALPFKGAASLRGILGQNVYIAPFVNLPSKENGLDIEGFCVLKKRVFVGLRGPVVDSIGIVLELGAAAHAVVKRGKPITHFLNLGGLGVRDLAVHGNDIIVLAGPVSAANGPFRIFRWRPRRSDSVQQPLLLKEWSELVEHPEGICVLRRNNKEGFLILYDTPDAARIERSRYRADWISLKERGGN